MKTTPYKGYRGVGNRGRTAWAKCPHCDWKPTLPVRRKEELWSAQQAHQRVHERKVQAREPERLEEVKAPVSTEEPRMDVYTMTDPIAELSVGELLYGIHQEGTYSIGTGGYVFVIIVRKVPRA